MTLALLLTAVTGAWAQSTLNVVEFEVPAKWEGDVTSLTAADFPGFMDYSTLTDDEAKAIPNPDPSYSQAIILVYGFDGIETKYIVWDDNDIRVIKMSVARDAFYEETTANHKIYYTYADPNFIDVKWNASTKTGTFTQPASDVVLTPIYAAATVYDANQTEKMAYETLKEAIQNVQNGETIKLDWNVTLTEALETPTIVGGVQFTLDFNGYTLDCGTTYQIKLKNAGDQLTFTDSSDDQLGGLIAETFNVESGCEVVFDAGRYNFSGATAETINAFCANASIPFSLAEGKEFVDLEGGAEANDGFTVRVDWKTFELTIGPKKFATFYDDNNITLAEGQNIGFYTISNISDDRTKAYVTPINSTIIPANTPTLVYNGGNDQQTVKLKVTTDAVNLTVDYVEQFKGTAEAREFTADDMAANDYFALSGGKAFAPVKGTGTIAAHKCWLEFAKQQIPSARQLTIVFDNDDATGVGSIDNGQLTIDNYYDLNGRKLNAKPTRKGVYIKNGQKVVK